MRWNYYIATLLFYPLYSFSEDQMFAQVDAINTKENTLQRTLISDTQLGDVLYSTTERTEEYPTQVIRWTQDVSTQQLNCEQINQEIDSFLVHKITKDKFSYATFISCSYDPTTNIATEFTISSYFDAINNEGVAYLKNYLNEYNGSSILGGTFLIEQAHALIVSLNVSAGIKKNPEKPPFVLYRQDRNDLYFKSTYAMQTTLLAEARNSFFTDDSTKVVPFLNKWLFTHAGGVYKPILRDSNYALFEPENIFLMDSGEPLYVSPIKLSYRHNCAQYEHQHCLKHEL